MVMGMVMEMGKGRDGNGDDDVGLHAIERPFQHDALPKACHMQQVLWAHLHRLVEDPSDVVSPSQSV